MNNRFAFVLSFALCASSFVTTAQADAFIKIETIPGESTDKVHKDEIVVDSFAFGSASSSSFTSAGASAGKVQLDALTFTHRLDRASAPLLLAVARGQILKSAVLSARAAGSATDYLKVTLTDVMVTSVKIAGDAHEPAREEVTLRFGKILFEYFIVQRDGKLAPGSKMGWDVAANKAL